MTQLASSGRGLPRYDYISDPTTGLVAAQVTLDDGTMFHTLIHCRDREEASEGAARVALEAMRLLTVERGISVGKGRGRGRRGKGRGADQENNYQPWFQYSGQEVQVQHMEKKRQEKGNNQARAGTEQMDIRYRNTGENQKQQQQSTVKPAFVPLHVARKAAKSKEKEMEDEMVMPKLEEVQGEVMKGSKAGGGKGVTSKESTPQRGQGEIPQKQD